MNKKLIIVLMCAVISLLAGVVYYFKFTLSGESKLYDILGGNNLHLAADSKEVYWFDVRHSNDPNAPMFQRIENALTEFNPDLVLVEGGFNTFEGDRDAAIYQGESAFATYLAKQNGTLVEDIEPPFDKQIEYLQSKYASEEILAMYLIRQISSEQRSPDNSKWDFDGYLLSDTQYFKDNGLNYQGETLEDILNTVNSFLLEPVNSGNWRDVDIKKTAYIFNRKGGVLYPVYNDVYNFRNIYLVDLIKEKKEMYNKIFIVMGGGHLADTKGQLNELYSN